MDARESRLRAASLLRRRSVVTAGIAVAELAGADAAELRRFVLEKLHADDLEAGEVAALVLVARHAGTARIRKDLAAVAADERRPEPARDAARLLLEG